MEIIDNIHINMDTILWIAFFLTVIYFFRESINQLIKILTLRVRMGSSVKIGPFELGAVYVESGGKRIQGNHVEIDPDKGDARYNQRYIYYKDNRDIFLVHKIRPSEKPNQLYDILIYLIPHKEATLANVQKVEYYFGKHWGNQIFTSIDRAKGFPIATSAFGPFGCTAKIYFTDGEDTILFRYIDFEMGQIMNTIPLNLGKSK